MPSLKSVNAFLNKFAICLVLGVLLGACSQSAPSPTMTSVPPSATATDIPTQTPLPPSATPTDTASPVPPTATKTATETRLPTHTSTASPTETVTNTPAPTLESGKVARSSVENPIVYYLIQPDTGGPEACGDSIIGIGIGVSRSNDISNDVTLALEALLGQKSEWVLGLFNPVSWSTINLKDVSFSEGLITVNFTGKFEKSDDKCDNLRVKAQIWSTIRQFRAIKSTNIYLNNVPFGDRFR